MKYLGLIILVALVASQVLARGINENDSHLERSSLDRNLNDKLRNFLENFKTTLREGSETWEIPVADPYVRDDDYSVKLEEDFIQGALSLSNFEIIGLSDYEINEANVVPLSRKVTVGLTWPHITSKGSYKLDVIALEIDDTEISGEGEYTVEIFNLSFTSTIWAKVLDGVKVKKMKTSVSLGDLKLQVNGLMGDDDISIITSEIISNAAPQLVVDYQREITDMFNEKVTKIINEKLKGKSISDIISILG